MAAKKSLIIDPPKRQFQRRQPSLLRGILGNVIEKYGLENDITRYQFVLRWKEIMGVELATRTSPECLRGKTLVVRVPNSVWAQELSFQKPSILARLKKFGGGEEAIEDISFRIG